MDDFFDIGEGAYYSDEENKYYDEDPHPNDLWEEEFAEIDEEV